MSALQGRFCWHLAHARTFLTHREAGVQAKGSLKVFTAQWLKGSFINAYSTCEPSGVHAMCLGGVGGWASVLSALCEIRKRWGSGLHLLGLSPALAWVNNPQTRACWGDYRDSWAKANTANAAKGQQQGERQAWVHALVDVMVRLSMTAGNKWMYMWSPNQC